MKLSNESLIRLAMWAYLIETECEDPFCMGYDYALDASYEAYNLLKGQGFSFENAYAQFLGELAGSTFRMREIDYESL